MIDFEQAEKNMDIISAMTRDEMRKIAAEITPSIRVMVRDILLSKYDATMSTKTGKMRGEIEKVGVVLIPFGRKPRVTYHLQGGVSDYGRGPDAKAPDGGFYSVFSAQSYGAVRGMPGAKRKEKRGIKKLALRNKSGVYGSAAYSNGKVRKVSEEGSVSVGRVVVTRPKTFWQMTPAEERTVQEAVVREFNEAIARRARQ